MQFLLYFIFHVVGMDLARPVSLENLSIRDTIKRIINQLQILKDIQIFTDMLKSQINGC